MGDENIKVDRKVHEKMRKAYGYEHKFYVEDGPYSRYAYLKKLEEIKLQKRGDKTDDKK